MNQESCLMSYFISDDEILSTCDFPLDSINSGEIIYEVIRIANGAPLFFNEHLNRFFNSIDRLNLEPKFNKSIIAKRIFALIDSNQLNIGNIRFQITNNDTLQFTAWVSPFFYPSIVNYTDGVDLMTYNMERENPEVKIYRADYKKKISDIITDNNIYEVLLVNSTNNITEGSKSNIFFVKNGCIYTPKSADVLPGITRQKIVEIITKNKIHFEEIEISKASLSDYDAAFISGTSPKILPIRKIDNMKYNPSNGNLRKLMKLYNELLFSYINLFNRDSYI